MSPYVPREVQEEAQLAALEAELAARESVPSPGLGSGSAYNEPPPPPPSETAPPPDTGGGWGAPTLDFLAPLGAVKDAAVASPVGQAIGDVLSTPLPGGELIPVPPPTAVGAHLADADPGGAAQLALDVATADPILLGSLLVGGPLAGTALRAGRAAFGLGRAAGAARTAAPAAPAITASRVAAPAAFSTGQTVRDLATVAGTVAAIPPLATGAAIAGHRGLERALGSDPAPRAAAPANANPYEAAAAWLDTALVSALGLSPPSTPPPTPARPPASTLGAPARQTPYAAHAPLPAPPASVAPPPTASPPSAAARPSASRPAGSATTIEFTSPEPLRTGDFLGLQSHLPALRDVTPEQARRMAAIANGTLRRRRGTRGLPFRLDRAEFDRIIRQSIMAALREAGIDLVRTPPRQPGARKT